MNDRTPTEATLLPCPFCGSTDLDDRGDNAIWCKTVNCEAGIDYGHSTGPKTRAAVRAAWNRRASPPAPAAEPVAGWRVTYTDESALLVFTEDEADEAIADARPGAVKTPLYTHPLDAAAIRAEADESADRQWCEGAKTAVSMLDPLVIGVDMWPQSAQAKYRAALAEIDRLIANRRSAIIESRRERRALADKGEVE